MEEFIKRMVDEYQEVFSFNESMKLRHDKALAFTLNEKFLQLSVSDQKLLIAQMLLMNTAISAIEGYLAILKDRGLRLGYDLKTGDEVEGC